MQSIVLSLLTNRKIEKSFKNQILEKKNMDEDLKQNF